MLKLYQFHLEFYKIIFHQHIVKLYLLYIISFKKEGYDLAIKRVIGIPGDTIDIKEDGTILVNNEIIDEPYLSSKSIDKVEVIFPITLDEDEYFVLGDNRIDSFDSKNYKIGNVKREEIIAKIIFKLNTFKKL